MIVIMLVTAGIFLMETILEYGASIFSMTSQRFLLGNILWILLPLIGSRTKRFDHVARRQGCAAQFKQREMINEMRALLPSILKDKGVFKGPMEYCLSRRRTLWLDF